MQRSLKTVALIAATSFLVAGCGSTAAQQSTSKSTQQPKAGALQVVTVASDQAPAQAGIILGDTLGYFKKEGIKIEYKTFASGEDELTALASGQVDVARGVVSAGLFNAMHQGIPVRIVADGGQNQPNAPYFEIALKKSLAPKVTSFCDLKGLKIGLAGQGTINEVFLGRALAKCGLPLTSVHEVVVDSFPDLNTAVANGAVDGIVQIEPLITEGVQAGYLSWWKNPTTYAPDEPVSVIEFGKRLLANKSLADRFMVAYLEGVRAYDNALIFGNKNQSEIIARLAKGTFVTNPKLWLEEKNPYLDPNGNVPIHGIKDDLSWYVSHNLTTSIPMSQVVDMSYAHYADKQLGLSRTLPGTSY